MQANKPNHPILKISKPDAKIELLPASEFNSTSFGPFDLSLRCFGIFGLIELLAGKYLIVVTAQSLIGNLPIDDAEIRQITGVQLIPCGREISDLSPPLQADERIFLGLLEKVLNQSAPMASGLYYSPTAALSRSLQSQFQTSMKRESEWKSAAIEGNDPFVVNALHLKEFSGFNYEKISEFFCCCIQGFVEIRDLVVNQSKLSFALISRRNVARTGARYHCRGSDLKGNVANFVETEQIIFTPEGRCASFLQIRGSMPFFWRQNVRIKYKPELEIMKDAPNEKAFAAHRETLLRRYKRVAIANLVDSHGGEAKLSAIFKNLSESTGNDWKYVEFDFHLQCKNMAYHNIDKLVQELENDLDSYGYFEGSFTVGGLSASKEQGGLVRTNCMDCLDRTNVVQSVLARRALLLQLKDFGILPPSAKSHEEFGEALSGIFRNVWADNADAISTQYSGTGALKTDFTRTGQRTPLGSLQDGINSALRYYFGNFSDGHRQDALDLLFGIYRVDPTNYNSPFKNAPVDPIKNIVTSALFYSICLFFFFAHFSNSFSFSKKGMLFCAAMIILLTHFIRTNGKRFVQKPRLSKPLY